MLVSKHRNKIMNCQILLPLGFDPPLERSIGPYFLEALCPKHNERDFEALTSSKEDLRGIIDPEDFWPDEVLSLEDNLRDLTKDFQEFKDKKTFRYSILSMDKSSYDGCFYIRPTTARTTSGEPYDCLIEFWFRSNKRHLENTFQEVIKTWLKNEWAFKNIVLPGVRPSSRRGLEPGVPRGFHNVLDKNSWERRRPRRLFLLKLALMRVTPTEFYF